MFPKVFLFWKRTNLVEKIGEFLKGKDTSMQLAEKLGTLFHINARNKKPKFLSFCPCHRAKLFQ
jgi:hypothetical protein